MGKRKTPEVLFNASVTLAGLKSPSGGSAKLLQWCKQKKIQGLVSEVILDEVLRNTAKIGLSKEQTLKELNILFEIKAAPKKEAVETFKQMVIDSGDAHVLASAKENGVEFLVTLDKKHLLVLRNKVESFKIVSPKQLIEMLSLG